MLRLLSLSLLLALGACYSPTPPHVRHAHARAKAHSYQVPLAEVWPFALDVLSEHGFVILRNEARERGQFTAESDWVRDDYAEVRYVIVGTNYVDNSSQVQFTRQKRHGGNSTITMERDGALEWELLRVVDPEAAARIQAEQPGGP